MSSMAINLDLVMHWAVFTTIAFLSKAEQFPYQTVMLQVLSLMLL